MPVLAGHLDNFTQDTTIKSALVLLENVGAREVFDNLQEISAKIEFYDLSAIAPNYANHFAINSVDSFGNRYILINTKYKNASPEEIACLIAHESCHKQAVATYEEEYTATKTEAYYWSRLKNRAKTYKNSALLSRLNNLSDLRSASTANSNLIERKINNSNFYRNQLADSPARTSTPEVSTEEVVVLPTFGSLIAAR